MPAISVMGLFCEDIREEKNDQVSLIGLLPDSINVAAPLPTETSIPQKDGRLLPKLCAYVRINFQLDASVGEPVIRLVLPNGHISRLGVIEESLTSKARREAALKGNLMGGLIFRAVMGNFQIPKPGVMKLEVDISGEIYLAAMLNFQLETTTAIVSEQPSLQ